MFIPQVEPIDAKTHPIKGRAMVDVETGLFDHVTSHSHADGVVPGRHKVIIRALGDAEQPLPVVPPEYTDPDLTPLEVHTDDAPWHLRVGKPGGRTR
jgi:hypothetical protein